SWPAGLLTEPDVARLAGIWADLLTGFTGAEGGHTPSDFPLVSLDQDQIEELAAADGLADVWPLSPLQEGLLFHTLYAARAADVCRVRSQVTFAGTLGAALLRRSWQVLLDGHANLRAGFRQPAGARQLVQVVARETAVPWREVDLTGADADVVEARAER